MLYYYERYPMFKIIYTFFDKLEDQVRGRLSRKPIGYAFLGGVGIVLFWRGVWHSVDALMLHYFSLASLDSSVDISGLPWWDGPASLAIGTILLLLSGLFVANFIGNEVILSGIKGEKKIVDKTEDEIRAEMDSLAEMKKDLKMISSCVKSSRQEFEIYKKRLK